MAERYESTDRVSLHSEFSDVSYPTNLPFEAADNSTAQSLSARASSVSLSGTSSLSAGSDASVSDVGRKSPSVAKPMSEDDTCQKLADCISSVTVSLPPPQYDIVIPESEVPWEFREKQYDAVLVYAAEDEHMATIIQYLLTNCVKLEDGQRPSVCTMDSHCNFGGVQSRFQYMGEALKHSTYMFMLITKKFCEDIEATMKCDECLMESIDNPDKRWCVIPVLTQTRAEMKQAGYQLPFGLRSLKGVNISQILPGETWARCKKDRSWRPSRRDIDSYSCENLARTLNSHLYLKLQRQSQQMTDYNKWMTEERLQRWHKREMEKIKAEFEQERLKKQQQKYEEEQKLLRERLLQELDNEDIHATSNTESSSPPLSSRHPPRPPAAGPASTDHTHSQPTAGNTIVFNGPVYCSEINNQNAAQRTWMPVSGPTFTGEVPTQFQRLESQSSLQSTDSYEVCVDRSRSDSGNPVLTSLRTAPGLHQRTLNVVSEPDLQRVSRTTVDTVHPSNTDPSISMNMSSQEQQRSSSQTVQLPSDITDSASTRPDGPCSPHPRAVVRPLLASVKSQPHDDGDDDTAEKEIVPSLRSRLSTGEETVVKQLVQGSLADDETQVKMTVVGAQTSRHRVTCDDDDDTVLLKIAASSTDSAHYVTGSTTSTVGRQSSADTVSRSAVSCTTSHGNTQQSQPNKQPSVVSKHPPSPSRANNLRVDNPSRTVSNHAAAADSSLSSISMPSYHGDSCANNTNTSNTGRCVVS